MTRVAAVDCGTNTVRLLVADLDPGTGEETELARESRMVRLGQGVDRTGRLDDDALTRLAATLEEYAAVVGRLRPERVRCCATSAVRDAANAEAFATEVRSRLGVDPEVVTGTEEARLSYDGATRTLTDVPSPVLVVDVGGGSTELVLGAGHGTVHAGRSLDVGSVRMTERHLLADPPTRAEVEACRRDVDAALDTLPSYGLDLGAARAVVAVSGTGLTVTAAALGLDSADLRSVDRSVVPLGAVRAAVSGLLAMTVDERRRLPYMPPGRADVIGAGAVILERVVARVPVAELRASVSDILDGIAWSVAETG